MSTYTEEEARTKWCPFARVTSIDDRHSAKPDKGALIGPHTPSYNRQYVQDFDLSQQLQPGGRHARFNVVPTVAMCIASGCMAWRVGLPRQEGQVFIPGGTLYDDALKLSPHAVPGIKQWGADQKAAGHVPVSNAAKFAGIALEWIERETPTGFCGLAGRPQ